MPAETTGELVRKAKRISRQTEKENGIKKEAGEEDISRNCFKCIVADPPWNINRAGGWNTNKNHRPLEYPVMSVGDIKNVPVKNLADTPSFLFLWVVNSFVEKSYDVARSWGFRPVTLLTWCKKPKGIGPGGMFASTTEFCLFCRKGSWEYGRSRFEDSSWFEWERTAKHSEKPEDFFRMIEKHFPGPYLELFARRKRKNWTVWGDEVDSDIEISDKKEVGK